MGRRLSEYLRLSCGVLLKTFADVAAEFENSRIVDSIEHLQAVFSPGEQSGRHKDSELPGSVGLCGPGGFDQLRDAHFPSFQRHQELQATWLTENAETGGDHFEGRIGEFGGIECSLHFVRCFRK